MAGRLPILTFQTWKQRVLDRNPVPRKYKFKRLIKWAHFSGEKPDACLVLDGPENNFGARYHEYADMRLIPSDSPRGIMRRDSCVWDLRKQHGWSPFVVYERLTLNPATNRFRGEVRLEIIGEDYQLQP